MTNIIYRFLIILGVPCFIIVYAITVILLGMPYLFYIAMKIISILYKKLTNTTYFFLLKNKKNRANNNYKGLIENFDSELFEIEVEEYENFDLFKITTETRKFHHLLRLVESTYNEYYGSMKQVYSKRKYFDFCYLLKRLILLLIFLLFAITPYFLKNHPINIKQSCKTVVIDYN
ncbi:MAG: hypothetical protein RR202_05920 [Bacteroidales bacterium]